MTREPLFGILNINKPAGVTSRDVVDVVCPLVEPARAGHAGTLDPLATGVLVVCVGKATRLIERVQQQPKVYRGRFRFGFRSDTDDIDGNVVKVSGAPRVSLEQIERLLPRFIGDIQQVPPQYSAVKVQGQRAYKRARRGEAVELAPRTVHVERIALRAFEGRELELEIECGSGTYIRSIGRDLGEALGCGAVMTSLERTAIGRFRVKDAIAADQLTRDSLSRHLLPPLAAVAELPRHPISPQESQVIGTGRSLCTGIDRSYAEGTEVALVSVSGELAAVAVVREGVLVPRQVFSARC